VDGDRVFVDAYFSNGKKARDARIVVMDANEQPLLEGRTDHEGQFDFPLRNTRNMTIVLIIDEAHRAKFELTEEDLTDYAEHQ
jgi:type I site-specific restriction-modification system R (restriction) subunit